MDKKLITIEEAMERFLKPYPLVLVKKSDEKIINMVNQYKGRLQFVHENFILYNTLRIISVVELERRLSGKIDWRSEDFSRGIAFEEELRKTETYIHYIDNIKSVVFCIKGRFWDELYK